MPGGESMRVLLVENDVPLAYLMRRTLVQEGHSVTVVEDARSAMRTMERPVFDAIILDRLLPEADGLDLCRAWRANRVTLPILMLIDDPMAGTERPDPKRGADDFLVKPFAMRTLVAILNDLLARRGIVPRTGSAQSQAMEVGDLSLDLGQRRARRGRRMVDLTEDECAILRYLMRDPGQVRTRTEITDHVWGYDLSGVAPIVDDHITHLRRKIDAGSTRHLIRRVSDAGFTIEA